VTLHSIPDAIRPGASGTAKETVSRWPEWTREELDALGLHPSTPLRPSLADFDRQYRRAIRKTPANWEELRRQHMARFDSWHTQRKQQKEYKRQAGLDDINQRRRHLLADKHGIERALLTLMTSPLGPSSTPDGRRAGFRRPTKPALMLLNARRPPYSRIFR
jgi:hypothetical protein